MDITAVLLAEYLGILRHVEDGTNQLRIPHSLIPALLEMQEKAAPHQPSKLAVLEEITDLVDEQLITVTVIVSPTHEVPDELSEAMEPDWIALLELARSSDGYLVDYLSLRRMPSNDAFRIPEGSVETLVNCRAVAESLSQYGPLSQPDLSHALSELGTEGAKKPLMTVPVQGKKLILYGNISE